MSIFESSLLGLLQALTEFLPVSSSAHLVFLQTFFGLKQPMLLFDVLLHFSTLCAVVTIFFKDIIFYLKTPKIIWYIILVSIPTGIIGIIIKKFFEPVFASVTVSSIGLIITGILLLVSEKIYFSVQKEKNKIININWVQSLIIGVFQGISVLPGISRSGATLSSTMLLNFNKEDAVKFVFIISIPAILAATGLELKEVIALNEKFNINYLYGMVTAFVFGVFALKTFVRVLRTNKLKYFSYYCLIVGFFVLLTKYIIGR